MITLIRQWVTHRYEVVTHPFRSPAAWRLLGRPHKLEAMHSGPTPRTYWRAFQSEWFSAMSGAASVVATILGFVVTSITAKALFALTAAACFIAASYRIWSAERRQVICLQRKLDEVALDRCISYVRSDFSFGAPVQLADIVTLERWSMMLENASDKMIRFSVVDAWVQLSDGLRVHQGKEQSGNSFINGRTQIWHHLTAPPGSIPLAKADGLTWQVGFLIEYDNVAPSIKRTTEQVLEMSVGSWNPPVITNRIVLRDER